MTDRSYLPYQSARDFQDRGMAKWAGFFLSEHSTALAKKELDISRLTQLDRQEKFHLLNQAYSQQVPIRITFLGNGLGHTLEYVHGGKFIDIDQS